MNLNLQLARLESEQLVQRLDEFDYQFKHQLAQETAYNLLLLRRRRAIHL